MRTLGVAVLGLFLGLIAGTLLTSAVARTTVARGEDVPIGTGLFLGSIMPTLGAAGAVLAVVIDRKSRRSR